MKLEEQKKQSFSNAVNDFILQEERVKDVTLRKVQFEHKLKESVSTKQKASDFKSLYLELGQMTEICKVQELRLSKVEEDLEAARAQMNEAMVERKIYEKLKEKAFEDYIIEEERSEQKRLDELISFKYFKPEI
jgi:flagellar FliJ protein